MRSQRTAGLRGSARSHISGNIISYFTDQVRVGSVRFCWILKECHLLVQVLVLSHGGFRNASFDRSPVDPSPPGSALAPLGSLTPV